MKPTIIILIIIAVITNIIQALSPLPTPDLWHLFKINFGKRYLNRPEDEFRRFLFLQNLHSIRQHNEEFDKGNVLYKIGVNEFSDLTSEELHSYTHGLRSQSSSSNKTYYKPHRHFQVTEAKNWITEKVATSVKNQGPCGSCWAFSTTGAIESHYILYKNESLSLSEQNLVDCVEENHGCKGGWMEIAYRHIIKNGITTEAVYPYKTTDGGCNVQPGNPRYTIKDIQFIKEGSEDDLKAALADKGPISVAIDATGNFTAYASGIYFNPKCSTDKLTHAVLVVGYGTESGEDYWIIKNSYSRNWGESGYFRMVRNRNNHCGIATAASFPVV